MRKNIKIWIFLMAFMFTCLSGINAAADEGFKHGVFDQAELFSETEVAELTEQIAAVSNNRKINTVVLTTNDANGKSAKSYGDDFIMDNGFYETGKNGSVLFLIDMDNREVYVSASGLMIRFLTDERKERIIDAGYDDLADGYYYDCMRSMINVTEAYIEEGIEAGQYNYDEETGKISRYHSLTAIEILVSFGAALMAGAVVCAVVVGTYRFKWGRYKYPFREKSSLNLSRQNDHFVNEVVTTRVIPKDPPPSSTNSGGHGRSSGGGGQSTTHTSSGGGTFSGSSRKF